ncbi:MAG: response regulator [Candidatus Omnitrophica bacterium]|nr:response regulator [Candidatus Omnitrophota bacterium]
MHKKRILIADDEPDFLELLKKRLEKENYEILAAANGEEAMEKARKNKPDLVISDVEMPRMDGCALLSALSKEYGSIPVILLTSHTQFEEIKKGMDLGAISYVPKPFKVEVLLGVIHGMIGNQG